MHISPLVREKIVLLLFLYSFPNFFLYTHLASDCPLSCVCPRVRVCGFHALYSGRCILMIPLTLYRMHICLLAPPVLLHPYFSVLESV